MCYFSKVVNVHIYCGSCHLTNDTHTQTQIYFHTLCFLNLLDQTVDNRKPNRPIFFTTEDSSDGALRRFEADGNGWDSLHQGGRTTFLRILDSTRFEWTTNESAARSSAAQYYGNSEGIIYHDGLLYFAAKTTHKLLILDLQKMTYVTELTGSKFEGKGSFNAQPDQIILENYKRWIYFSEDGGSTPGVYVRDKAGTYRTLFEGIAGGRYDGDETVGIALSPDRKKLYAGVSLYISCDDNLSANSLQLIHPLHS